MINGIAVAAEEYNRTVGVTGGLYYDASSSSHMVVQVLEGSHVEVDRLLETIKKDPRHANIRIIERSSCAGEREFEEWGMKECSAEEWQQLSAKFPWIDELGGDDAGKGVGEGEKGAGGGKGRSILIKCADCNARVPLDDAPDHAASCKGGTGGEEGGGGEDGRIGDNAGARSEGDGGGTGAAFPASYLFPCVVGNR